MLELRDSPLLATCAEDLYARIEHDSPVLDLKAGEKLFGADDVADGVWLLLDGELAITKNIEGEEFTVDHLSEGAYVGEISLLTNAPAGHSAAASMDSRVIRIPGDLFNELLRTCASTATIVVKTLAERVRKIQTILRQREKMAMLGTLSAGITHELNNPAAAAKRAAGELLEIVNELPDLGFRLMSRTWSADEIESLRTLRDERDARAVPPPSDPLERNDLEDRTAEWLEAHGVEDPYEMASCVVEAGFGPEQLEGLGSMLSDDAVAAGVPFIAGVWLSAQLLNEVKQAAEKIASLVGAIKTYSKSDTSTQRRTDVSEEVATSLLILSHKLRGAKVATSTELDAGIPKIQTYGTELYQVWTNLIDNAIDAMDGKGGRVAIRARVAGDEVAVDVEDNGPGIPPEVRDKIFDPFFTTKEAGKGTGLGLEIVRRIVAKHKGRIDVASEPGRTVFTVTLPVDQEAVS